MNNFHLIVGKTVKNFFICINKTIKTTQYGDLYIDLLLQNKEGIVKGKIWKNIDYFSTKFDENNTVAVKGTIISYRDVKEIKVDFINSVVGNNYQEYGFSNDIVIPVINQSAQKLFQYLNKEIQMLSQQYKKIVLKIYNNYEDIIKEIPSIDNMVKGGYIQQIYNVLLLNKKIYNTNLNNDKVISGILIKYIGSINYFNKDNFFLISDRPNLEGIQLSSLEILNEYISQFKRNQLKITDYMRYVILDGNDYNDKEIKYIKYLFELDKILSGNHK